ncbi:MAG: single-stranded DNA-binding protein [Clostridia bacterium]|nr:single-stranded DNA-binding protein [Clostridia bacterium]
MLNNVVIMGRLTADPELRQTASGIEVTSFSVAVDRGYVRQGEERQTDFINCVAWRQSAKFITSYFHKGSMIAITGSLQTRNYEDKTGAKRTATEVVVDSASFCGSKAETGTYSRPAANDAPVSSPAPSYSTADTSDFEELSGDDDLPF